MKRVIDYLLILIAVTVSGITTADIYKWTDENGRVHFSDTPPPNQDVKVLNEQALAARYSSYTQVAIKLMPFDAANKQKPQNIVMYTTSQCSYCAQARNYFADNKIPFIEKNIEHSQKFRTEFDKFGGKGVPVLFWDQYKMTGFRADKFAKMYAESS